MEDTLKSCLEDSGETIQAELDPCALWRLESLSWRIISPRVANFRKVIFWTGLKKGVIMSVRLGVLDLVLGKELCHRAIR